MTNASRDQNSVPTILGAKAASTSETSPVLADPSTHALAVDDNTTGSDNGPSNAPRDQNDVPALMAVSSADGKTPVVLYVDSDGKLLINSN